MAAVMAGPFRAVQFDWRGTLFPDEDDAEWIRATAASIGRALTTDEVKDCVAMLSVTAEHPEVVAARQIADCSAELHRAAVLLELRLAGFDDTLAEAICDRAVTSARWCPYPDAHAA